MSVVGIDLGYQACHVAVARYGGVEVVANEYSDRRSPSLVAFGPKCRLMGQSAKNQHVLNYKNTVYGFRNLLGRKFSDPYVQQEMKRLPFTIFAQKDDSIGIKVRNDEGEKIFSPEQATAMMFTYLKKVAEKALGKPVADCVISVPSYFTDSQRRGLLDASAIAGLNCLRLFNDTTAAALAYGIYKQDLPAETEKPRNVVFVSMGYTSLEVSICSFQKGKLNVLAKAFDPDLGGRNFDFKLADYFSQEFQKKYKIAVQGHPKRFLRLLGEVEKLKKMMSTVTTPVPLNLECFADDKDVSGTIKRDVFQELCSEETDRVRLTLEKVLSKCKLSLGDIDVVEVIGGSTRIPAVKEMLVSVFKHDLSTTLNVDEAISRGCALQCAMLSPTFKVRDFSVTDVQPYPIHLKWQAPMGEDGEMLVYKEGDQIYHSKMLTFYRKEPFYLEASYASPKHLPFPYTDIGTFTIQNVTPTDEGEASKVKVKVRINIHGVFYVKDATMVEKQKVVEAPEAMETESLPTDVQLPDVEKMAAGEPAAVPDGEVTTDGEEGKAKQQQQQQQQQQPQQQQQQQQQQPQQQQQQQQQATENMDGTSNDAGESASSTDTTPETKVDAAPKPPETKKPKKPTVKYTNLPIVPSTPSMTKKALDGAHEIEVNLKYQDQLEQERADSRNAVEEYVYGMRDKLDGLADFISAEDRAVFSNLLSSTEDWLYDEGEDQPKKVYVAKLVELRKHGDPVILREKEFLERPAAFNELGTKIIHFEKFLESYLQGVELYNHIDAAEVDKVKEQVATKRSWHETQMQACQATPKHLPAPITCAQIMAEAKNLESSCGPIMNTPKPKPKEEPPKDNAPPEETNSEEMTENSKEEEVKEAKSSESTAANSEDMDLD